VQGRVSIEAVITLLLLGGMGAKKWADKWGRTLYGTVSFTAVIILLRDFEVRLNRRADMRGKTFHGSLISASVIILLLISGVGCEETGG